MCKSLLWKSAAETIPEGVTLRNSMAWQVQQELIAWHYSFLMSQKSSCFAAAWDLAPCPHSQCLFRYVLLMPTKFSCLAAAWDLAPCPHFHYLPNDLLHHQAGDRKGKVSNFRWLRDRKIGSGILSSSGRGIRFTILLSIYNDRRGDIQQTNT